MAGSILSDATSGRGTVRDQPFVLHADTPWVSVGVGVRRQILAHAADLMLVRVEFAQGAVGALHHHPHRQITWVANGQFRVQLGDVTRTLVAGDCFLALANVPHSVVALEAGTLLDSFTPAREDFVAAQA